MGDTKEDKTDTSHLEDKKLTCVNNRQQKKLLCGHHPSVFDTSSVIPAHDALFIPMNKRQTKSISLGFAPFPSNKLPGKNTV